MLPSSSQRARFKTKPQRRRRMLLEELESRFAPATIVVNTTADDPRLAMDSLRAALYSINHGCDVNSAIMRTGDYGVNDTIRFDGALAGKTILLTHGQSGPQGPSALTVGLSHHHTTDVVIDGSDAPGLTISGPTHVANLRLFYVRAGSSLTLNNLTLTNGQARGSSGFDNDDYDDRSCSYFDDDGVGGAAMGGAILNKGTLSLNNDTFSNNVAAGRAFRRFYGYDIYGGACWSFDDDDGEGDGGFGGGGLGGAVFNAGKATVTNTTFVNNHAGSDRIPLFYIPGFYSTTGGSNASYFSVRGQAGRGGAIYNDGGALTVVDSTFSANAADGGRSFSPCHIDVDATGHAFGGGIFSRNGSLTVDNATFSDNVAEQGGALFVVADHRTVAVTVNNSILANTANGKSDYEGATLHKGKIDFSGTGNLVENPGTDPIRFPASAIVSSADPNLGPLANNGGPTMTMALLSGSPAIGTGDVTKVTNPPFSLPFTDQRGLPRIVNGKVDIGAYQTQDIVNTIATQTQVTTSQPVVVYGTPVTFTAIVSAVSGTPTGSVEFFDDSTHTDLGAGVLQSGSTWTLKTAPTQLKVIPAGAHIIRAVYTPTGNFLGSSGILPGGETVTPFNLTVSGITANNKVYDHTTKATLNTGAAALVGVFAGDTVTLNKSAAVGTFASKDVGTDIPVAVSGLTLAGAAAGNYTLTQPTTKANITPATLTVSGITANNKIFDGTTAATLNTSAAALVGLFSGDSVTLNTSAAVGTFVSPNVGNNITVNISGLTISGPQVGDYVLVQPTTKANITAFQLVVAGLKANNKVYDRTTTATIDASSATLQGVHPGDNVTLVTSSATATFADRNVANNITVTITGLTLAGAQAGNYSLVQPVTTTASITPRPLTVTGLKALDKVYDGTTTAKINPVGATLVGVIPTDSVALDANASTGTFASSAVGNNITVNLTGLVLSGPQAFDYTVTAPNVTANILPDLLNVPLQAFAGAPQVITGSSLRADSKSDPTTVVFTLVSLPTLGPLKLSGTTLVVGSTFTQNDINTSKLVYTAGISGDDSFQFTATDGKGGTVPLSTFVINVVPPTIATVELLEGLSGLTPFTFTVNLLSSPSQPVTFDVFTTDGTAKAGVNFIGINPGVTAPNSIGTVTFATGQVFQSVTVWVMAGTIPVSAGPKTFTVSLSDPAHPTKALTTGTGVIIPQDAQMAAGTPTKTPGGVTLSSTGQLTTLVQAAEDRWVQAGVKRSAFDNVKFKIANIGNRMLAYNDGNTITIDAGAAGFGWFVDPTPSKDTEFSKTSNSAVLQALSGTLAAGHMDLETVIEHELGHILGYPDVNKGTNDNLMTYSLSAGTRRLPVGLSAPPSPAALDVVFAALAAKKQDGK